MEVIRFEIVKYYKKDLYEVKHKSFYLPCVLKIQLQVHWEYVVVC